MLPLYITYITDILTYITYTTYITYITYITSIDTSISGTRYKYYNASPGRQTSHVESRDACAMMNAGLTDQTRKRKRGWVYSLRILFQMIIRFPVKSPQTFELNPRQYLHKHPMRNVRNANSCDTPRVPMQCLFFTHTHTHTHTRHRQQRAVCTR